MNIFSVEYQSFKYNGNIYGTILVSGCNFRCGYCNLPNVINSTSGKDSRVVMADISKHISMDGICVSGGEPTIYPDLSILLKRIKMLGLKTMVETNGSNPEMIEKLIKRKLVDVIRLDLKAPPTKYHEITESDTPFKSIMRSINILNDWDRDWEITTVWHPKLTRDDLVEMAKYVPKKWVILEFLDGTLVDKSFSGNVEIDEDFLTGLNGPKEIWVRKYGYERRIK